MEFSGKDVADAIRAACEHFTMSREQLRIEVLETGSSGIFGLIRKKARIRVAKRQEPDVLADDAPVAVSVMAQPVAPAPVSAPPAVMADEDADAGSVDTARATDEEVGEASPESVAVVRDVLDQMLCLMGMPMTIAVSADGLTVACAVTGPYEERLVGPDGRVIDSIQYLLRKIAVRRCPEPLRIAVNVGDFRERRLEQLRAMALQLAEEVRSSGKTRIIPALNPSERREIHLLLQTDTEVRSRSVGDGVFKRILIFKPGRSSGRPQARRGAKRQAHEFGAATPPDGD
jgi:spoIIIJ-associated protein